MIYPHTVMGESREPIASGNFFAGLFMLFNSLGSPEKQDSVSSDVLRILNRFRLFY